MRPAWSAEGGYTGVYEREHLHEGYVGFRLARSASGRASLSHAATASSLPPSCAATSVARGVDGAGKGSSAIVRTHESAKLGRESVARRWRVGRASGASGAFALHALQLIHGQLKASAASRETLSARRHPMGSAVMNITRSVRRLRLPALGLALPGGGADWLELGAPSRGTASRFRPPSVDRAMGACM